MSRSLPDDVLTRRRAEAALDRLEGLLMSNRVFRAEFRASAAGEIADPRRCLMASDLSASEPVPEAIAARLHRLAREFCS